MRTIGRDFIHQTICDDCLPLHDNLLADLYNQLHATDTVKSHLFNGRYENIYIAAHKVAGLEILLKRFRAEAAGLLQVQEKNLKIGFWFNLMQHDDVTLPHCHDDDDELLSGTYYLQVPTGSGKLLIHHANCTTTIQPNPGQLVLFHPAVEHEVTQHRSETARISLGFNIGPK